MCKTIFICIETTFAGNLAGVIFHNKCGVFCCSARLISWNMCWACCGAGVPQSTFYFDITNDNDWIMDNSTFSLIINRKCILMYEYDTENCFKRLIENSMYKKLCYISNHPFLQCYVFGMHFVIFYDLEWVCFDSVILGQPTF